MLVASYIYIGQFAPKDTTQLWVEPKGGGDVSLHVFSDGGWKVVGGGDGKSAYELAVEKGYSGTLDEWLESLQGKSLTYNDLTDVQRAELAQDAVAAANRAAQAVETIEAAINDLNPSQSAEDAVVALAARQGVLENGLSALGLKLGQTLSIDIAEYPMYNTIVNASGVWEVPNSGVRTSIIPIPQGTTKLSIKTTYTYNSNYAFLVSDSHVTGENVSFASGCQRVIIEKDVTYDVDVPQDAKYLAVRNDNVSSTFTISFTIDRFVKIESELSNVESDIAGINAEANALQDDVDGLEERVEVLEQGSEQDSETKRELDTLKSNIGEALLHVYNLASKAVYVEDESELIASLYSVVMPFIIINFKDNSVKTICVTNWDTDNDGELTTIEASKVSSIGELFSGNTSITSFDEFSHFTSVTSLSSTAFNGCTSLESIKLPLSLTTLNVSSDSSHGTFARSGLKEIDLNGVTYVGNYAFYGCASLKKVQANNVTQLLASAFNSCSSLESITINPSATAIGGSCFQDCASLKSITFPSAITSISYNTCNRCSALKSVVFNGNVTAIDAYAFQYCTALTTMELPSSVTTVGDYAFRDCSSWIPTTFPTGLTTIGTRGFSGCSGIAVSEIDLRSATSIGQYAFAGVTTTRYLLPNTPPTLANKNAFPSSCSLVVSSAAVKETYLSNQVWATLSDKFVIE